MADGFFPASQLHSRPPAALVAKCSQCGLWKQCQSPKMEVDGQGEKGILLLGEAPGAEENEKGRPFVGPAGRLLKRLLESVGINMRRDCWLTNSIICWPGKGNPTPTDDQIAWCHPNLTQTIKKLKPKIIVPLGQTAVKSLIGNLWREDVGTIGRWVGWQIPNHNPNSWICPTYHPSYPLRNPDDPVIEMMMTKHLRGVADLAEKGKRPWTTPPDFAKEVQRVLDPAKAAKVIRSIIADGLLAAFDYETTSLKPEGQWSEIVCCSISDGVQTVAYPWLGEAIDATEEFIDSPQPKVIQNAKFEARWTYKAFGKWVRNVVHDPMICAHVLDNRPGISGLKFQAYVRLGQLSYDDHIKPHLQSKKGKRANEIREEVDLDQLLRYCGTDSLLELKLAKIQAAEMGVEL